MLIIMFIIMTMVMMMLGFGVNFMTILMIIDCVAYKTVLGQTY